MKVSNVDVNIPQIDCLNTPKFDNETSTGMRVFSGLKDVREEIEVFVF